MYKEVQLLLSAIDANPDSTQLSQKIWQQIISLYHRDEQTQIYLIEELAKRPRFQSLELHIPTELNFDKSGQETINQIAQSIKTRCAENKNIAQFQERARNLFPNIDILSLSREEWLQAIALFQQQQYNRLTIPSLLPLLSKIKQIDEGTLVVILAEEQPTRRVKPIFNSHPEHQHGFSRKRKREEGENLFLFASNTEPDDSHLYSPLSKTGARIIPKPSSTPTENGYDKLYFSPNKRQKIRPFFSNAHGTLFKPQTPPGNKHQKGRVDTSKLIGPMRKLKFDRPTEISFTATLEKMQLRQGTPRRKGQAQLTGARCIEIFQTLGCDDLITISGNDYHWSHMIAYFLGGEHSNQNLIPSTAAANYNVLEVIEHDIAEKLTNGFNSITIVVTPHYDDENDSLIPDLLMFKLTWSSPQDNATHFEQISINPRSYQRVTNSMHKSIAALRKIDSVLSPPALVKDEDNGSEDDLSSTCTFGL